MRIEQLVMYGPNRDDRVVFAPGLTVLAGLLPSEREEFVATLVDALTGRLPGSSLIYTDAEGRRVYSDETGATFSNGAIALAPQDLLGMDPEQVRRLLTIDGVDLGLGGAAALARLETEVVGARGTLERRIQELGELRDRSASLDAMKAELAALDERLAIVDDEVARWEWLTRRRRLDQLRAELNLSEQAADGRSERQMAEAVEALRNIGGAWAGLAADASTLRSELGPLPAVSTADLALVAATPAERPTDFDRQVEAWRSALDLRVAAEEDLSSRSAPPAAPDDALVIAFAELDQTTLWKRHADLVEANDAYRLAAASGNHQEVDAATEEQLEAAHLEVVRRQGEVDRATRIGLGVTVLLVLAGLATAMAATPSLITAGLVLLALSAATVLVMAPRRRLADARRIEDEALTLVGTDSWLGFHMRRLDALADPASRRRFEALAERRATAQVAWDEIAGAVSPEDLTERATAVRRHAEAIDPKLGARRQDEARAHASATAKAEATARKAVASRLRPYGLDPDSTAHLDPDALVSVVDRRIAAGEVARRAAHLAAVEEQETAAARRLSDLLRKIGFAEGTIESRLERAIESITAARERRDRGDRSIEDLRSEIATLAVEVREGARPAWTTRPEPTSPPVAREMLMARRGELDETVSVMPRPDVAGAEQRVITATAELEGLEVRLAEMARDTGTVRDRLLGRLQRTSAISGTEEPVPVILDEALAGAEPDVRAEVLDLLAEQRGPSQVIVLTGDPEVAAWARTRCEERDVVLYEAIPQEPEGSASSKIRTQPTRI